MTLDQHREPVFNIPMPAVVVVALLVGVHLLRAALPIVSDEWVIWAFGFVPARYDASILSGAPFPADGARWSGPSSPMRCSTAI